MSDDPYAKFANGKLILRDHLATDRTILANERTFLAYLRTFLTFLVAGVSFIKFFDILLLEIAGWFFVPLSFVIFIIGVKRYLKTNIQTNGVKNGNGKN